MSEKTHFNPEAAVEHGHGTHETHEHQVTSAEHAKARHEQQEEAAHARHEANRESSDKQKVLDAIDRLEAKTDDNVSDHLVSADLKGSTLQKEMRHIRRKLTPDERVASKFIHNPIIRNVSDVSSKTLTRPSGLLGGGIVAFLGTTAYLYITKDIGIKYNYTVFLVLLVLGFAVGLMLEAVIRLARLKRV